MTFFKNFKRFFYWGLDLRVIEEKVDHIAREQETMKGNVRQMQQKADSLRRLVENMRRKEDWF